MHLSSLFLSLFVLLVAVNAQDTFTIDTTKPTVPFTHFWEECVGSGHAVLGLRADWQAHLTKAHNELGFKQVRFHGLFDDDMSALIVVNNQPVYSWFNIDSVFDFITSIGMRPYVELSFMPEYLASGPANIMHYKGLTSMPNNVTLWEDFITNFAEHIIDRYGWDEISQWNFEFWNEPNCGFFNGTQTDYFNFYKLTITALKKVNSGLRVGGPATCQSAWLSDFMTFCAQNNLPYDFVSTHTYPTDIMPSNRDIMLEVLLKSRSIVGPNVTLYYSEFNDGLYGNPAYHDTTYASSFLFHVMHRTQGLVDTLSWWTFTDIFEEQGQTSQPFFGVNGWGLLNMYQVPKPSYRAFQILHGLGTQEIPTVATAANTTAGVYAILSTDAKYIDIIAYNFDLPDSAITVENVTIVITGLKATPQGATMYRIDDTNANAAAMYLSQGSPAYPTSAQIQQQIDSSVPQPNTLKFDVISQSSVQVTISLPKWGSAHLQVTL